jgi:hypothetical protein
MTSLASTRSHQRRARVLALALVTAAAALAPAPGSSAQVQVRVAGGPAGGFGPGPGAAAGISKASLDRYAAILGLSAEQKETAAALHEAYTQDRAAASRDMQAQLTSLREGARDGDASALVEQIPALMRRHAELAAATEKQFIDDVRALLTAEQADRWPRVERLRRREQWLRAGPGGFGPGAGVSGSTVDLVAIVEALRLSDADRARLADTLEEYEQGMDRVLQDRDRAAAEERARAADGPLVLDADALRAFAKSQHEQAMKVREVNQRYARILASLLPDDQKAAFEEQFRARSFRAVYGDSAASRRLAAAERLDDLTPQQRDRLAQIRDAYRQAARPLNDRWAAAQEQAENEGRFAGFPMMLPFGAAAPSADDPVASARQARRDLDRRTAEQVDELLTAEQRARLPADRARRFAGADGGPSMLLSDEGPVDGDFVMVHEEDDGQGVRMQAVIIGTSETIGADAPPRAVTIVRPPEDRPAPPQPKP